MIKPPIGGTGESRMCDHKYVHYDTKNLKEYFVTSGMSQWTKIDYFFCEKCLDEKEKRKSETSRYAPEWY